MLRSSIKHGAATLGTLAEGAVKRLLGNPRAKRLFTDDERWQLGQALAATNATAELLGRARIRRRLAQAEKHTEAFAEATDFSCFDDNPLHPLSPLRALEYFRRLIPGLFPKSKGFDERHQRQGFTLAVTTEKTLLSRIKDLISRALETGQRIRQTPKDIDQLLDDAGVSPRSPQYAEMAFRTNMMSAYNEGSHAEMQEPDIAPHFPVWQYLGIRDGRQGKDHEPHFDKYYPNSASFEEVRGPRAYNCVLPGTFVAGRFVGGFKAWYRGKVVEIKTRNGHALRLTINHPVLTDLGFKAAGLLEEGDNLLGCEERIKAGFFGVDDDNAPALIQDVFESFAVSFSHARAQKRCSAFEFHGDGKFIKGDIQIVGSDISSGLYVESSDTQNIGKFAFCGPNVNLASEPSGGPANFNLHRIFLPTACLVSGHDLIQPLSRVRDARPFETLCLGWASRLDSQRSQPPYNGRTADAELHGELIHRFPGIVEADQIVSVKRFQYDGHVYDLGTDVGYYSANSIIISNCRCTSIPVYKKEWARLQSEGAQVSRFAERDVSGEARDASGKWTAGSGSSKATKPDKPDEKEQAHPGAAHGSKVKIQKTNKRGFSGEPVQTETTLTKQETGRVGEAVILAYLRKNVSHDAKPMNSSKTNFAVDLIEDHAPTEVKAGLVSNTRKAQQWRLTFSKESKKEKELYAKMTPKQKKLWNAEKQQRIKERKEKVIRQLEKEYPGQKIKPRTMTAIINPDTKTADIYSFEGFHDRIDWQSDLAKKSYVGSVKYAHDS